MLCLCTENLFIYLFMFTGIYVQSCGHPSLTGLIYICVRRFVLHNAFTFRDRSKVVDLTDYVLVACLFFCSVTRICIRERFWSRIVDNLYKHPSNTYIVKCSDLFEDGLFTSFHMDSSHKWSTSGVYTHQHTVIERVM